MSASREAWLRLQAALAAVGVEARLDERSYSQAVYGRVEHGVSRSLFIRLEDGSIYVGERERYGSSSWAVGREDREGIQVGRPVYGLKRRADVVEAVRLLAGA